VIFGASATHALRALAHLAAVPGGEAMLGRDLAREVGVPAHYLSKVLATLARAGLLAATRGAHGGYRLARPAREIPLVEIVEPFEGQRARPGCLLRPGEPCVDDRTCSAHPEWAKVTAAYLGFLESTTLADIQEGAAAGVLPSPSPAPLSGPAPRGQGGPGTRGRSPRTRRTPTRRSTHR
jgi:Rrf2 family protein